LSQQIILWLIAIGVIELHQTGKILRAAYDTTATANQQRDRRLQTAVFHRAPPAQAVTSIDDEIVLRKVFVGPDARPVC
jgi:hypothetical protein